MNEIALSDDLNVITAEINSYKQVAGQSIFEIGRRLKHVKENDLVHGEFMDWYLSLGFTKDFVSKTIRIVTELPNFESSRSLGIEALNLIATLPQEEREKEHTLSSGETKAVDEMAVRELQELKKQIKEKERQLKQAKTSEEIALRKLEEAENKAPEIIEREVIKEIDNTDYDKIRKLEMQIERMKASNQDVSEKEKEVKLLQLDASKSVLETKIKIDDFLQEVAVTSYRKGAIAASSDMTKNKLKEGIDDLKNFIKEMELALNGTIEHH